MADDQKDRFIQYLVDQNQDLRLTSDAMNPNRSLENRAFILYEIRHNYGNN